MLHRKIRKYNFLEELIITFRNPNQENNLHCLLKKYYLNETKQKKNYY